MRANFQTNLDANVRGNSYAELFDVSRKLPCAFQTNLHAILLWTVRRKLGSRCPRSSFFRKLRRELSRNLPRSLPQNLPPKLPRTLPCKLLRCLLRGLVRKLPCKFPRKIPQEHSAQTSNCAFTQPSAGGYTRFYTHTSPRTAPLISAGSAAKIWRALRREQPRKLLSELGDNCFQM